VDVTSQLLREWPLPQPDGTGDKHDRGTVLVIAGTTTTPGAALLTGTAALRVGAGRLQIATCDTVAVAVGVAVPESLVIGLTPGDDGAPTAESVDAVRTQLSDADAVVIGPGLPGDGLGALLERVLGEVGQDTALALDAGALVALADIADRALLPTRTVLSPNAGELAALLDVGDADEDERSARAVAEKHSAVTMVRGCVVAPDGRVWRNAAGNPGLGTSGSGDVLAGVVGGLLARGADAAQAAVWAQHLHATAGDRLAGRIGPLSFLARDLLDELPAALSDVGS
jgi:hydroxyethylthiazole kinase-like uncharacterized protein yjeF